MAKKLPARPISANPPVLRQGEWLTLRAGEIIWYDVEQLGRAFKPEAWLVDEVLEGHEPPIVKLLSLQPPFRKLRVLVTPAEQDATIAVIG
jgi:hypothetical protein